MWIKNTITNLVWRIEDEKQIKYLLNSGHFEEVESPDGSKQNKSNRSKASNEIECEICNKICEGKRSYTQHKRMAHGLDKNNKPVDTEKYNAKFSVKSDEKKDGGE